MEDTKDTEFYTGYKISWVLIFIGSWIYCIASYGYLLGVGLGWLPSLIVATLGAFLWQFLLWALCCGVLAALWYLKFN